MTRYKDAPPDTSDCTALMREAGAGIYLDAAWLIPKRDIGRLVVPVSLGAGS